MDRRDFLQFMMVCYVQPRLTNDIAGQMLSKNVKSPGKNSGDKGSVFLFLENGTSTRTLRQVDWNTYEFQDFPLPLELPHSLVQDPHERSVVFVFETFGSFARVDLKTGAVVKVDHRHKKGMSYGHATFASTGELLCTEVDPDRGGGLITVRSPRTLEKIGTLPPECGGSHQIASLPGGKVAACGVATDFGRGPSGAVVFTDGATKKTLSRIELPSSVSHVVPISNDEVIALGLRMQAAPIKPIYGDSSQQNMPDAARTANFASAPIFSVRLDGSFTEYPSAGLKDLFKFNFAFLKIPHSNLCVTTHLGSHRMIVWDGQRKLKVFELPFPTNLTASADGSEFMVVSDGKTHVYSARTLEETKILAYDSRIVGLAGYKRT